MALSQFNIAVHLFLFLLFMCSPLARNNSKENERVGALKTWSNFTYTGRIIRISYIALGMRILCSKIKPLCYSFMLTVSTYYALKFCYYARVMGSKYSVKYVTSARFHSGLAATLLFLHRSERIGTFSRNISTSLGRYPCRRFQWRLLQH